MWLIKLVTTLAIRTTHWENSEIQYITQSSGLSYLWMEIIEVFMHGLYSSQSSVESSFG